MLGKWLASIITTAGRLLQDFLAAQDPAPAAPPHTFQQQWQPPDSQNYKANFDAAVFKATNSAGIGVIIKDCDGEVFGALSLPIPLSQSVDELEALACRRAVRFAWEIGLSRVTFKGDSATVIQAITRSDSDFLPFGNIIDDIRHLVSAFQFSDFCHVNCGCNIVADALAKRAKLCEGMQVWLECLPEDISPLVFFDVP
ncbi:hypothetical protein SO802_000016 [Lithocarpus litseifolius]|uniref:RNase H type-1 domain-containing protein n=1 Tax=Lithocarpus litseifolius TaxID=425828 RepID=A0AAW2DT29_9ROSI